MFIAELNLVHDWWTSHVWTKLNQHYCYEKILQLLQNDEYKFTSGELLLSIFIPIYEGAVIVIVILA